MTRIFKNSALLGGAALAIALASGANARAQIIGIPTGADYSPYDTFAERWYDPGDWYGGGSTGRVGRQGGLGATSIDRARDAIRTGISSSQDPRGLGTEVLPGEPLSGLGTRGALGRGIGPGYSPTADPRSGASPYGMQDHPRPAGHDANALFQQGDSPYSGWRGGGAYRDFYDASPARPSNRLGANPDTIPGASGEVGTRVGARGERNATLGTGLGTAGGEVSVSGRGDTVARSGRIDRDSTTGPARSPRVGMGTRGSGLDQLFGRNDYVERGALPNPNYGRGPRYRGYYSDDWYSDSSAFDDWYDGVPSAPGDAQRPGLQGQGQPLDRPSTNAPGALGEPSPTDRPATGTDLGEPPATLREPGSTGTDRPAGTGTDRPATLQDEPEPTEPR